MTWATIMTSVLFFSERSIPKNNKREVRLRREAKLACAMGQPDEDESSSILKLAQEVQRAAEDELSFYGSLDSRERMDRIERELSM